MEMWAAIVIMVNDSPARVVAYNPDIDPSAYSAMVSREIKEQKRVQVSRFIERFGRKPKRKNEPNYLVLGHVWHIAVALKLDRSLKRAQHR